VIWAREMISGAYVPRWVAVHGQGEPVRAVAFVINHAHERYARYLPDEEVAGVIASASGTLGPCADYLINTVDHLAELGVHDRPLERLRQRVVALCEETTPT
jgi:cation transport protein ChaC